MVVVKYILVKYMLGTWHKDTPSCVKGTAYCTRKTAHNCTTFLYINTTKRSQNTHTHTQSKYHPPPFPSFYCTHYNCTITIPTMVRMGSNPGLQQTRTASILSCKSVYTLGSGFAPLTVVVLVMVVCRLSVMVRGRCCGGAACCRAMARGPDTHSEAADTSGCVWGVGGGVCVRVMWRWIGVVVGEMYDKHHNTHP